MLGFDKIRCCFCVSIWVTNTHTVCVCERERNGTERWVFFCVFFFLLVEESFAALSHSHTPAHLPIIFSYALLCSDAIRPIVVFPAFIAGRGGDRPTRGGSGGAAAPTDTDETCGSGCCSCCWGWGWGWET
eukprot:Rhum_TRINITY_DN2117_c0_g1::Rhum_TRINITY_DN2117_c0_g1_i1::g.5992::m.5992